MMTKRKLGVAGDAYLPRLGPIEDWRYFLGLAERTDGGATCRGESEQFAEVMIPGEMFWPMIRSRIKERRVLQRNGVHSHEV